MSLPSTREQRVGKGSVFDDQSEFQEQFEWGEAGIRRLAPHADVVVIVDVLSFATAVDVAVGRGATIYPCRWRDDRAMTLAERVGAVLADGRSTDDRGVPYSLSPVSLREIPAGTRLVLPSPNGATLTLLAAELGAVVVTGCLRNAAAVATACRVLGQNVAVVAAGERWQEADDQTGSLRPAVEDLVGAGAVLTALQPTNPSPEAVAAMAAFRAATLDLDRFLAGCASGRELRERGFGQDVGMAAQLNVSSTVPLLRAEAFVPWEPQTLRRPSLTR
jgi:2-phosphosulfolactate phosphatase